MRYVSGELEHDLVDDNTEKTLNSSFGRNWHTYRELTRKDDVKECYWCKKPETKRAHVNIWGVVYNIGACDVCYDKNNGVMRDEL